ncbi:HesA/MoeB/ThiF family protein [Magnetococcales bacterium HHB-1]
MKILLIGAGGLGCAFLATIMHYPTGEIILCDPDKVALSNLQRQILYRTSDIGHKKILAAKDRFIEWAPQWKITTIDQRINHRDVITTHASGCDIIVDGSDNFTTRFAANDAAIQSNIPLIHGASIGFRGQVMAIIPQKSACLRCLFIDPPPQEGDTCRSEGVFAPLVGEIGSMMARFAWRIHHQQAQQIINKMFTVDLHEGKRRPVRVEKKKNCLCKPLEV